MTMEMKILMTVFEFDIKLDAILEYSKYNFQLFSLYYISKKYNHTFIKS